ncbi:DEAD/DEAH box helicase family protein [Frigidibacter mobilis]|uniref:DEAD/DEAH box helicase family protein n=1 Tax=Frigidibacter mobilis TaxID=1335048 RepID=UPI00202B7418|nr:DEAD/DEAH box helicase family protein [Frigidibacter mobilis]
MLAATTAFGKTVVASALIGHRARNTLVLVHRRELLDQWVERLKTFLQIDPSRSAQLAGTAETDRHDRCGAYPKPG